MHPDLSLFPAFVVRYNKGNYTQVDLNLQLILKNKVWIGAAYRSKNTMVGMFQFQVNNQLRISYSYNFISGEKAEFNYNSHEIMFNYAFNYKAKIKGPRHF